MLAQGAKAIPFDKGLSTEFDAYFKVVNEAQKDPKQIFTDLSAIIKCQRRHLIEGANFEEACPTY
jgi:DNA-directed RNA polymerase subunit N (RpoN/RPB10)